MRTGTVELSRQTILNNKDDEWWVQWITNPVAAWGISTQILWLSKCLNPIIGISRANIRYIAWWYTCFRFYSVILSYSFVSLLTVTVNIKQCGYWVTSCYPLVTGLHKFFMDFHGSCKTIWMYKLLCGNIVKLYTGTVVHQTIKVLCLDVASILFRS